MVDKNKVKFKLNIPKELKKFFKDDLFWIKYGEPIDKCPEGILNIPPIVTIAPIAWASGTTVEIDKIDYNFSESLKKVQKAYQIQYPDIFNENVPEIKYKKKKKYTPRKNQQNTSSVLFSMGVDSLACYVKHRKESPALLFIKGVGLDSKGQIKLEKKIKSFSRNEKVPLHTIKSNFKKILEEKFLNIYYMKTIDRDWWGAIHYGTGLPSLCAPITFINNYNIIYEGSGYTEDPTYPTAQPSFVNPLSWGETKVRITEVEMTRQDKIEHILKNHEVMDSVSTIRSCRVEKSGRNCSMCEKCRRTIVAICVEGANPNDFGFKVDKSELESIKNNFLNRKIILTVIEKNIWEQIQEKVQKKDKEEFYFPNSDFYGWFETANLDRFITTKKNSHYLKKDLLDNMLFNLPYPTDIYLYKLLILIWMNLKKE